jgi:K+-sensing histidine kinase KdpD
MISAGEQKQPVIEDDRLAVPIMLRGEVLGAIEVDTSDEVRRDDALEVIETVMNRLAVNLENARLFQTAQETTAQEQRINEIVGLFQDTSSVDDLLQITLQELSTTLGANAGMIRLTGRTSDIHERPTSENGSHLDGDGDRGA